MGNSTLPKFLSKTVLPATLGIAGLLLLLIGYSTGTGVAVASGWILVVFGAGWMLVLYRTRIYRLPVL